ncbi:hypothetical protein IQ218_03960 [Synechocystis salina LEGE 06099]|uniref:hypothetical protein n=1 Tax=Synechocystis salina TaxID=945780 RepID=UPI001882549C|nr:hypothetical protein [Synechocystis salina]MBE9202773.1 hypothetical protein [Synechocystis salina LEGE 06099]
MEKRRPQETEITIMRELNGDRQLAKGHLDILREVPEYPLIVVGGDCWGQVGTGWLQYGI